MTRAFLISTFVMATAALILGLLGPSWIGELKPIFLKIGAIIFAVYALGALWGAVEWIRDKDRSRRNGSGNMKP